MTAKKAKLVAAADENAGESGFVEIVFRATTFIVPRSRDDWPTRGLAYLSEGKYNLFAQAALEIAKPGQWDTLCRLCPRQRDYKEFFVVFSDVINAECVG
jgi:hypothetical protein